MLVGLARKTIQNACFSIVKYLNFFGCILLSAGCHSRVALNIVYDCGLLLSIPSLSTRIVNHSFFRPEEAIEPGFRFFSSFCVICIA